MKKRLAVFDIDGTLFRSSLLIELTNALVSKNIFPKEANDEIEKDYKAWVNREGEYGEYIGKVIGVYEKYIIGKTEKEIDETAKEVLREESKKLYRFTRDLIMDLKRKNYFLFAISGSPGHILTSFAKEIGFDKYLGGYYELVDGRFTGKQPYGNPAQDKKTTLNKFLNENKEISLLESIGVGDTESDISFLEIIENPIAFNPNQGLARHAREKGWRIVVERKDVIYDVKDFDFIS